MSSESLGRATPAIEIVSNSRPSSSTASHRSFRVVDFCNVSSSANTILKRRVLAMRAQGIDNRIICVDGPYVRLLEEEGIPVFTAPLPRGFDLVSVVRSFVRIYGYLKREKIDLVHTHFSVPGFVGRLAARLAGVPVIVHTIHGLPYNAKSPKLQRLFYVWIERSVGKIADVVLSQNRGDLDDAARYKMVPRERLRFIGNGISLEKFHPTRRAKKVGPVLTIACVARLETVKNHTMLFEAVRLLAQRGERFRLVLVGGGDLGPEYQALCARLGIADRVEFLGYRDDIPAILAETDISVLTSIKEGVPRAILESMGMAIPVVATRIPGNVDAVREGETGYTVEIDDVEALAEKLTLLMHDPALRDRLGRRAREVALEEFDEDRIIDALSRLYRSLLLRKGIVAGSSPMVVASGAVPRS